MTEAAPLQGGLGLISGTGAAGFRGDGPSRTCLKPTSATERRPPRHAASWRSLSTPYRT